MGQDGPKIAPRWPKMIPRAKDGKNPYDNILFATPSCPFGNTSHAKSPLLTPKRAPRRPQDGPRMTQHRPRSPQDGPKMSQDGPRWSQDGEQVAQDAKDNPQDATQDRQEAIFEGCPQRFHHFYAPAWPQDGPLRPSLAPRWPLPSLKINLSEHGNGKRAKG